ncbi:MAG TPA: hypothetical protein VLG50_05340 [Candidatus Saccharimonadales bacterium]|nr:hypothetical protein [Candidatus Saccharimonadales bacterium]
MEVLRNFGSMTYLSGLLILGHGYIKKYVYHDDPDKSIIDTSMVTYMICTSISFIFYATHIRQLPNIS